MPDKEDEAAETGGDPAPATAAAPDDAAADVDQTESPDEQN